MSDFCPEWIFGSCIAQTAKDFLSTNNTITSLSKKFSVGLSEHYNEIRFEEISDGAEKALQFLSDIKAGENAVEYLTDYIHYRVNFKSHGGERKLSGIFSSGFAGEKLKSYSSENSFKVLKATVFSIRNNSLPKASPGWVITDVEDIDWLGDLFIQETQIF
ncbi:hypothetical protein OAT42_03415 [Alphaproteobacteria bacterium]|nr:hypothetical protein [Alphaproteobacteria bacterium]